MTSPGDESPPARAPRQHQRGMLRLMMAVLRPRSKAARDSSLRRQWKRAFALLTAVVLLVGVSSFLASGLLLRSSHASAIQVEAEAELSAALRTDLVSEAIVLASPITAAQGPQISKTEARIAEQYARATAAEGAPAAKRLLAQSEQRWDTILAAVGPPAHPNSLQERGAAVTTAGPEALALLERAASAGRAEIRSDLSRSARLDRYALISLALSSLLTIGIVVRLARRLSARVLQPVSALREAANRLSRGELDHRVDFERCDELGELAASFNTMADAIAGTQRTLSLEANTDSLSGLANRAAFRARVQATLEHPDKRSGQHAVLFVDLDDFKDVNDTLGHAAGDEVLRVVADRLSAVVRPEDSVARLGGDEFAILLCGLDDRRVASRLAGRVVDALAEPVAIAGSWVHVGASVGIAFRRDNSTLDQLLHEADRAMYTAKGKGKNRAEEYDADVDEQATIRHMLKTDIATAAVRGQLVLDYQPIADLQTGGLVGLEALVRWQHPTQGLLPPSAFIELAEDTGAIQSVGAWALETAVQQLKLWQTRYRLPSLGMSINVSVRQLDTPLFEKHVKAVLDATGIDPATITLEVTESVLADPGGTAAATLSELRHLGLKVALDDFGTGYSSIGYLHQLPIDAIKIDRSFVSDTYTGGRKNALLEAIVSMAHHLGLSVVPEGIEEFDQLARLREMGCKVGQGFLLSRPIPADTVELLLATPLPMPHLALSSTHQTPSWPQPSVDEVINLRTW